MAWTGTIDEYFINHWPQGKTVTIVGAKGFTGNVKKSSTTVSARKDLIENGQVVGQSVALIFGHATQSEYTLDKIVLQAQVQDEQNPRTFATYLNNPGVVIETAPEFAFQIWCSFRLNSANTVNVTVDPAAYVTTQILEEALANLSDTYMVKGVDYVTAGQKSNTTLGTKATAEGRDTISIGNYSHAEGQFAVAYGASSHAEGLRNVYIHVNITGDANATTYTVDYGFSDCKIGAIIEYNGAYAKIKEKLSGNKIKLDATLSQSEALSNVQADLVTSIAYGYSSHSENSNTIASGNKSHAEGEQTIASGIGSHAEGYLSRAQSQYSHAENGITTGDYSHAETGGNAIGSYSHAEGTGYSFGINSHAECGGSAFGKNSHAESDSFVDSITRVVSGSGTSYTSTVNLPLSSKYKIIRVEDTNKSAYITSIDSSNSKLFTTNVSLGTLDSADVIIITGAFGESSHTEGYKTSALKNYSHSEGNGTVSAGESQHVSGKFNVIDIDNTYAEIIGNGTSENIRKNARTLDWSGNEWLAGTIKVGGISYTDSNAKELATKEYVDNAVSGVFIAEYGTTSYSDISQALNDNKTVFLKRTSGGQTMYSPLISKGSLQILFQEGIVSRDIGDGVIEHQIVQPSVSTSNSWGTGIHSVQPQYYSTTTTLTAAGWNSNTQTVTISLVTAKNLVQVSPDPTSLKEYGSCGVYCSAQGASSLTFTCDTIPTNNLTINVVVWR